MNQTTVFTEILKALGTFSKMCDHGRVTWESFLDLQRLGQRIQRAHCNGYFSLKQYNALNAAYFDIEDTTREIVHAKDRERSLKTSRKRDIIRTTLNKGVTP